jgi:hypothetical protein
MKRSVLATLAALTISAATAAAAFAALGGPQQKHTSAGTKQATGALLQKSELGTGWKAAAPSGGLPSCDAILQPQESELVEIGKAAGPLFVHGAGQALTQSVDVFASDAQANLAWRRTVTSKLILCLEQQVENASTMGDAVSVTAWYQLHPTHLHGNATAVRVVAKTKTGKTTWTRIYFDVFLFDRAKTITRLVLTSFRTPFSQTFEQRLQQLTATRLSA